MPDPIDPQAFLKLCEMSIDNMYEFEALGELLQEKVLINKQKIVARAKTPSILYPRICSVTKPYLFCGL